MSRRPLLSVLLLIVPTSCLFAEELPTASPADVGMSAAKLAEVDGVLGKLVAEERLAGVTILVARHGKVVHFESFGQRDREAGQPMTNDTIHRIYSMSKAITSAAIMILVDEGQVQLDDPVSKYVPELAKLRVHGENGNTEPLRVVTVRDLLLHTSGLGYGGNGVPAIEAAYQSAFGGKPTDRSARSLAEFSAKLAEVPLAFEPGTSWQYGVSIDVLGRVVEVASKQEFETFLRERIFEPLDMRDTGFHVPEGNRDRLAANYNSDGKGKLTPIDPPSKSEYLVPPKFQSGGGGLVSTARDYARFLQMIANGGELFGKRILSKESVARMTTNQLSKEVGWIRFGDVREGVGFGLGFSVRDEKSQSEFDPDGRVGEYGWGGAASTHYWVSPKDDLIVVTLEQVMPYSFMTEFAVKGLIYEAVEE